MDPGRETPNCTVREIYLRGMEVAMGKTDELNHTYTYIHISERVMCVQTDLAHTTKDTHPSHARVV